MLRSALHLVAVALMVTGIVAGLLYIGKWTETRVSDKCLLDFAKIDCPAPPGMTRLAFLEEVRYVSRLPARLRLFEDRLSEKLATAFAAHPWVKRVDRVVVRPPSTIRVELTFRRPVLAVRWQGMTRAVDEEGVLLPANAVTEGLPLFEGEPSTGIVPAGKVWNDPRLLAAAKTAAASERSNP